MKVMLALPKCTFIKQALRHAAGAWPFVFIWQGARWSAPWYSFLALHRLIVGVRPVAGLPHGAFDLYIMTSRYQGHALATAIGFYLGLIALTVLIWSTLPLIFLASFLAYSAYHFGDSDWPNASSPEKLAWGSAIVGLPCLIASDQVAALFETITGVSELGRFTAIAGMLASRLWCGLSWITHRQLRLIGTMSSCLAQPLADLLMCYALACALGGHWQPLPVTSPVCTALCI